ncbi:hypothetical protein F2Q70_00014096 [Brassica cretica]|uniref:Kinesin-like protein n=1 Tax=Brassica cretica TaxID=69181 RepID=A0A8S9HU71_BRACR|nr:hypothetical protein F2Q70_00014096 [Brassica cretica]
MILLLSAASSTFILLQVVNDLLNPVGQNLRIREDEQGAFIEGIKEEVVLSPAHALSLIAAGEEHRHIGSTSFNLLSSRSHTMFTLTIESSPLGGNNEGEAVHLSQLNLIDLAGSESSKAATSGLRRKEGSYINKSLLTLGTVVNDLLNPVGQNLRIREDEQGAFIEGIKEEVVLSPAHALSLIAAGEEHRHIGSTSFNLLSSRSHTMFTLTIESSPLGGNNEGEAVHLSQLNLIDLAGSESSKAATSGLRRKEGSYINKSLLTLGTVISKLTDRKASHVPFRDSKLTRLLQSSLSGHGRVSARRRTIDQMDILREQQKILSEEMALQSKSFKQLSEEATKAPENEEIEAEIINLNDDIKAKNDQIAELGKQILDFVMASHDALDKSDIVQAVSEMRAQLNEKSFELEVKAADNRIIQEQLNQKTCECEALQEEVASLKQQLSDALELGEDMKSITSHMQQNEEKVIQAQAFEIEELKLKAAELSELKEELELRNQKLAEESSYAKELASAAAVELRALSEEVASLMNRNERLAADLAAAHKSSVTPRGKTGNPRNGRKESPLVKRKEQQDSSLMELKRELSVIKEREVSFEAALVEKVQREAELQRTIAESKEREAYLENELANMWVLVAKLRRSQGDSSDISVSETRQQTGHFGT